MIVPTEPDNVQTNKLEADFGDDAEFYAQVRAEAARLNGRRTAAEIWRKRAEEIASSKGSAEQQ
jgi:hypothetical protein